MRVCVYMCGGWGCVSVFVCLCALRWTLSAHALLPWCHQPNSSSTPLFLPCPSHPSLIPWHTQHLLVWIQDYSHPTSSLSSLFPSPHCYPSPSLLHHCPASHHFPLLPSLLLDLLQQYRTERQTQSLLLLRMGQLREDMQALENQFAAAASTLAECYRTP